MAQSMRARIERAIEKLVESVMEPARPDGPPFGPERAGLVLVDNSGLRVAGDWLVQTSDFRTILVISFDLQFRRNVGTVTLHPPKSDGEQGQTFTIIYDDAADTMDALLSEIAKRCAEAVQAR